MLSEDQWSWLQAELQRPSQIKVIASGVQVLPPTDQRRGDQSDYCADGSHTPNDPTDESFDDAIHAVGEDLYWQAGLPIRIRILLLTAPDPNPSSYGFGFISYCFYFLMIQIRNYHNGSGVLEKKQ